MKYACRHDVGGGAWGDCTHAVHRFVSLDMRV